MDTSLYPASTGEIARKRRELAPKPLDAFKAGTAAGPYRSATPRARCRLA